MLSMELSGRAGSGCTFISSPPYMQVTQQYILSVAPKNISAIMPGMDNRKEGYIGENQII